jgi:hypothetical protein
MHHKLAEANHPFRNPDCSFVHHLFSGLVEDVGQVAATTVLTIVHGSHENTGTAL